MKGRSGQDKPMRQAVDMDKVDEEGEMRMRGLRMIRWMGWV